MSKETEKKVVLKAENITMQFGGVIAINNLNLTVKQGEICSLIGPNGAGKTTAFNCITGVYQPTNGLVEFEGKVIVRGTPTGKMKKEYAGENAALYAAQKPLDPTPDEITRLGIARTFQNIRLWKSMTVFDNVLVAKHMTATKGFFSAAFHTNRAEEKRMRDETMELLAEQGLEKYKDDIATGLPYGLQRRLEIARALATEPRLLLLDEPAAGMNPQETLELSQFIKEIRDRHGLTVFLVEHHMDLVMKISDYIYVIDFGKLISEGEPAAVQNDQRVIDAYLGVSEDE